MRKQDILIAINEALQGDTRSLENYKKILERDIFDSESKDYIKNTNKWLTKLIKDSKRKKQPKRLICCKTQDDFYIFTDGYQLYSLKDDHVVNENKDVMDQVILDQGNKVDMFMRLGIKNPEGSDLKVELKKLLEMKTLKFDTVKFIVDGQKIFFNLDKMIDFMKNANNDTVVFGGEMKPAFSNTGSFNNLILPIRVKEEEENKDLMICEY